MKLFANDEAILSELQAQTAWLRLLGLQALRPLLAETLKTDKQRLVYELSDGNRTSREIAAEAGVGAGTVSRLWSEWISAGICVDAPGRSGRARHFLSLTALGMEVPGRADRAEEVAPPVEPTA